MVHSNFGIVKFVTFPLLHSILNLEKVIIKMKYQDAPDLKERMVDIIITLEMNHIDAERVECLRSFGSSSPRTIARCHALGKLMQKAMKTKAFYAIEFLERFERMKREEQDKVIIHELMHIPKTFGGGFRQHDYVCEKNIEVMHEKFVNLKKGKDNSYDLTDKSKKSNQFINELINYFVDKE